MAGTLRARHTAHRTFTDQAKMEIGSYCRLEVLLLTTYLLSYQFEVERHIYAHSYLPILFSRVLPAP